MQSLPENVRLVALSQLSPNTDRWWVRNASKRYSKFDMAAIYWIVDEGDRSITIAVDGHEQAMALTGREGLAVVSNLLDKAYGARPWESLGVSKFAETIMALYSDPRSHVTTPAFFEKQRPVLQSWLTGREKEPGALQQVCVEPAFNFDNINWALEFNAINRRGGIERWAVKGRSPDFKITGVAISTVKEDGTFYFPEEM